MNKANDDLEEIKLSIALLQVLRTYFCNPLIRGHYGAEIIREYEDLTSGTIYPLLKRLVGHGYMYMHNEVGDPIRLGRPLRRYYFLTGEGRQWASAIYTDEFNLDASIVHNCA